MTRSRIAATLAGLACVAIARAEEPPPARGIAEFFARPGATTMPRPRPRVTHPVHAGVAAVHAAGHPRTCTIP